MATIKRFEDLDAWIVARQLVKDFNEIALTPDFSKDKVLTYQMRRAAISVLANIAEGFERNGNKEFIHFCYIAKASCGEFRALLYAASDINLLNQKQFDELFNLAIRTSRTIYGLITYLKQSEMKGSRFMEPEEEYLLKKYELNEQDFGLNLEP